MKRIVIALLLVLIASSAAAQTIFDMQTGLVPDNTPVQVVNVVVTGVRYNGVFVAEAPYGVYNHIWVYTGSGNHTAIEGDIVNVQGEYYEYYGFSEIDADPGIVQVVGNGPVPAPIVVTAAMYDADPEPYESCLITIPDMMTVTTAPSTYGEWFADTMDPVTIMFDDYWYDADTVLVGDCYQAVTGIVTYSFDAFRVNPKEAGIEFCPVATDDASFGTVKSMYR